MKYKKITGNIFSDYEIYVGQVSLYGQAFFGHKATKKQKAKLGYIWKQLLKLYKGDKND